MFTDTFNEYYKNKYFVFMFSLGKNVWLTDNKNWSYNLCEMKYVIELLVVSEESKNLWQIIYF